VILALTGGGSRTHSKVASPLYGESLSTIPNAATAAANLKSSSALPNARLLPANGVAEQRSPSALTASCGLY
jgi:hypothetical protein